MTTSIATNNTATETYTPANTTQQPITFLPAITEEQAINWSPDRYARHRRMVLTMLTRDHEQLLEAFGSDLELLEETLDVVSEYIRHLGALTSIVETAQARLMVVVDATLGPSTEDERPAAQ